MEIKIEEAKPSDARNIREVSNESWVATYPNSDAGISREDIEERLKDALSDDTIKKKADQIANAKDEKYLVAKIDRKIVGYCHGKIYPDKNRLHAIYILPEYTGQGIGTKLWENLELFFDPKKKTTVEVATYNINAIAFYSRLGFKDNGRRFCNESFRMKNGAIIPELEMEIPAI